LEVAKTFVKHMQAYYAERSAIKRDKIASDAAHLLKPYLPPRERKLRLPKFVGEQLFANADPAARKLVEVAHATEAGQDGPYLHRTD
jgi:hypothetical protein